MRHRHQLTSLAIVCALLVLSAACGGHGSEVDTTPARPATEQPPSRPPAPPDSEPPPREVTERFPTEKPGAAEEIEPTVEDWNRQGVLRTVYFAFDRYDISPDGRATLRDNSEWLKGHPSARVVIEGHCDERGSIEYNIALGQNRARAVRDYLVSLGLEGSRMRIVSYGEERPVDAGHSEAAWSRNRRAQFVIER